MSLTMTIVIAVIVALIAEIILFAVWIMTEAFYVRQFNAPSDIDNDFFREASCNGIPYILDNGLPYKGSIDSAANLKIFLNDNYKFAMDSNLTSPNGILGIYDTVSLPHVFNGAESRLNDYQGDVWYEKSFFFRKDESKPKARLVFMGSFLTTDVWLDGKHLGQNNEGYLPFSFDISNIFEGEHKLVIRVNNEISENTVPVQVCEGYKTDHNLYGGIHKEVFIEYLPEISLFKFACIPFENSGRWFVNTSILLERTNKSLNQTINCSVKVTLKNKTAAEKKIKVHFVKGEKVGGISFIMDIDKPVLWSETSPALYKAVFKSEYEESAVNFGLRQITWDSGIIKLNGQSIFLKGVSLYEESGDKGNATDKAEIDKEMKLIKEMNGNFVRLAAHPHSSVTMDIADRSGIMLWEEIPFSGAGHKITYDRSESLLKTIYAFPMNIRLTSRARDQKVLVSAARSLIKLIERDINHPSVISWGLGGNIWSLNEGAGRALGWLKETVIRYDKSRAVNYSARYIPKLTIPFEKSFRYTDWVCIDEFYGSKYGKIEDIKLLTRYLYRKYPDKPLVITDSGTDTRAWVRDSNYPPDNRESEDYQDYYLEETFKHLLMTPSFSGIAASPLRDFGSPQCADSDMLNIKGVFDKDLNEKQGYATLQNLYKSKKN